VNYSPNDPAAAQLLSGAAFGTPPVANGYRISQSGPVGGVEAGYNWQWSNWLLGVEADFSLADMSGRASGTTGGLNPGTQTTTATQDTDWYGTVRGRAGWLATPNLLLFGTGGFAYGRVDGSANYMFNVSGPAPILVFGPIGGFGAICQANTVCFAGSSSEIRTGWTAGGGAEWLLDQHWSVKIEYQFVDLGTETIRITALNVGGPLPPGTAPASFNAAFHDRFNVVRVGLNYQFH
jgi:outer membrane immunogenic protein